jgi:hypothetical protein
MSFAFIAPEFVHAAASDLASLGSTIGEANRAAAASTIAVAPAALDEVSTAIAALFSSHAGEFHALGAQAAAFHAQFVQALFGSAGAYGATEAANASAMATPARRSDPFRALSRLAVTLIKETIARPKLGEPIKELGQQGRSLFDVINDQAKADRARLNQGTANTVKTVEHVVQRGEGKAQTVLRAICNDLYQIETDIEGRIIRTLRLR